MDILAKAGESRHDQASGWEGRVREEGWGHVNDLGRAERCGNTVFHFKATV